ncbi:MAG: DUF4136 domain-containing protein [Cytophagales bacterium]|nr:DUF4136 domain-containing protein [Cytophagales bacterium]
MKKLNSLWLLSIIFLGACSSITVTSDYDKEVDFTKYKTFEYYGWTEESDKILNRFDKERIEQAFGAEFAKRGLKYVDDGGDMVVSLFIVVDKKTSTTAYTNHYNMGGYGYGPGWGWYGGYGGMGTSTTTYSEQDYLVGTLVVDVFDKAGKKLIWQSVGQKTVDDNPNTRDKNTAKVAAAIMKPFPIQPVKE